jgi:uncharacterized membrane protein HdeD (DUF308 family)
MAENIVDNTMGKIFGMLGITGILTAILMILFGVVIIIWPDSVAIIIGVYLIIVGGIQMFGYFPALMAKKH